MIIWISPYGVGHTVMLGFNRTVCGVQLPESPKSCGWHRSNLRIGRCHNCEQSKRSRTINIKGVRE